MKKVLRSRLRYLSQALLPRTWVLRASLRRIDRHYKRRAAQEKGEEHELLRDQYMEERAFVEEELESIPTERLLRRMSRYYIVAPRKPRSPDDYEDENRIRGGVSDIWRLKPAAIASLQRQIDEVQKRRREAWEAWAKILGSLITGLNRSTSG
jgi:hypothetical protein